MNLNHPKLRSGFTLIELLIVIAIITLLAAILFPVFSRARESGRRTSCASNLKQIGLGLMQYVEDYDGILPADWIGPGLAPSYDTYDINTATEWMDMIQPYVKSTQVFDCPSGPVANRYQRGASANYGSYSMNHTYYEAGDDYIAPMSDYQVLSPPRQGMVNSALIAAPTTTVWIAESGADTGYTSPIDFFWERGNPPPISTSGFAFSRLTFLGNPGDGGPVARHLETSNILYCDGHVKSMKLQALAARRINPVDGVTYLPAFTIQED